jgi:hypothetical protein
VVFSYYARLSRAEQKVYRQSDALVVVPVPAPRALKPLLPPIEAGLLSDDRAAVEAATRAFVDALLVQLQAPPITTKVLAVRPADDSGELHGLYVAEDGKKPVLRVWMRTVAQRRPVAFRTFVRTVLLEVCHHLDFFVTELPASFHTDGFFKRESHLARQLLGPSARAQAARAARLGASAVVDEAPPVVAAKRARRAPTKAIAAPPQLGFAFPKDAK